MSVENTHQSRDWSMDAPSAAALPPPLHPQHSGISPSIWGKVQPVSHSGGLRGPKGSLAAPVTAVPALLLWEASSENSQALFLRLQNISCKCLCAYSPAGTAQVGNLPFSPFFPGAVAIFFHLHRSQCCSSAIRCLCLLQGAQAGGHCW